MDSLTLFLFALGFVLLIYGADLLVRGASKLALAVGISPLVVGLTVVAYGTSAPELAVSLQSSYAGAVDLAVGNVVGSNIANVLLILGLSAMVAPLVVSAQLVRLDVPLMIGISFLLLLLGLDGELSRWDGLLLAAGGLGYTAFSIWQSRRETRAVQQEFADHFDGQSTLAHTPQQILLQLGLIAVGLLLLVVGANWLVDGAVLLAREFGISELVIGLTIVAVGTSLPELATSIVASMRGERDIAVGNIVGSNIFNILVVLGFSGLLAPTGISVSTAALVFDLPVMIVVAIACLPIFFTGSAIARWEGVLFFGYYLAYVVYLLLTASQHEALPMFSVVMLLFVGPLTLATIIVSVLQAIRGRSRDLELG
ncbi:MAG TPA: calcium/sodium antiporter [Anaerolineae bacterium]|nr:calcium/sodium antiporter [Anaerolineae bacterium]HMR65129.1 calcium/sodium antiporter [Anaerolineae bacterium]